MSLKVFLRYLFMSVFVFVWIFSGWPQFFRLPPSVSNVEAAISGVTARGSNTVGTGSNASLAVSPSGNVVTDKLLFVAVTADNIGTADGCGGSEHSLKDTDNHAWVKIFECIETDGSADDGNTTSLFVTKATTTISTTDVITVTFSSARTDAIISLVEVTFGAGKTFAIAQTGVGQNALSATISVTSREYLLFGLLGAEGEDTAKTPDAGGVYGENHDLISTSSGLPAVNVQQHVQTNIATLTGDTVDTADITYTNALQTLTAVYEVDDPTYAQSNYRFFNNADSTDVGSVLAGEGASATLATAGAAFRLRLLLHVGGTGSILYQSGQYFKLQFAARSGDCDTGFSGETYADVTAATVLAYNDNATPTDGSNLTSNGNDPTHTGHNVNNQTYEEANDFTNSRFNVPTGDDSQWDFSLKDNGAPPGTTYCFRVVKSNGTQITTYTVIPEIATAASSLTFVVSTNVFQNFAPGTPVFATTTLSVETNNAAGWNVTVVRDDGDTTLDLDSDATTNITDQTAWSPGAATTSAGNSVRIATFDNSGDILAFRVMTASGSVPFRASTWWGAIDEYIDNASSLWAGLPSTAKQIGNTNVTSGGAPMLNTVLYYLDVPVSQKAGAYSGTITYTATAN